MSEVAQALHGYREGHRLLAASRELSPADRQRIAVQSDNSDAGRSGTWGELLAGYPLPSGLYAWSMTWPAPEMPRSGCVWAHTLIFDPQVTVAATPAQILAYFTRPREDGDFERYTKALAPRLKPSEEQAGHNERELLAALIWSLYEPPLRAVRLTGVPWSDHERHTMMLGLWLQQWPALRATWSLTDAPSTPRRIEERRKYDLQLHRGPRAQSPEKDERILGGIPSKRSPRWAAEAATDIFKADGLREFLHTYGPEAVSERAAFSELCDIWIEVGEKAALSAEKLLVRICRLFPDAGAGTRLKGHLLNPEAQVHGCEVEPSDCELLVGLLSLKDLSPLPIECLDPKRRLARIANDRPSDLEQIVVAIGRNPNPLGLELIELIAEADFPQLRHWLLATPRALTELISMRPALAGSTGLWREIGVETFWSAIAPLRGKKKREEAIRAMLEVNTELDPGIVLEAWPESAKAVLVQAISAPKKRSSKRWLAALPNALIVSEINTRRNEIDRPALHALLGALGPEGLRRVDLTVIADELDGAHSSEFTAKAFVASILNATKRGWERPALHCFEQFSGRGATTPRSLGQYLDELSGHRVDPGGWKDEPARSLNLAFQEDSWNPLETLCLTQAPFKRLIAADKKAGLARRILDACNGEIELKKWQEDALIANVEERADRDSLIGLLKRVIFGR